jgi:hypothetical protein
VTPLFSSRNRLQTHGPFEKEGDHAERCHKNVGNQPTVLAFRA